MNCPRAGAHLPAMRTGLVQYRDEKERFRVGSLPAPVSTGSSAYMDPDRVSLLGLPPEIRNFIYDQVFHDNGNKINGRARKRYPTRDGSSTTSRSAGANAYLGLLYTCRQVYHETAPIYYASELVEVCPGETHRSPHDFHNYIVGVAESLLSLGSQLPLLRKIWIDISSGIPGSYYERDYSTSNQHDEGDDLAPTDVAPLLLALWNIPNLLELQFVILGERCSEMSGVLLSLYRDALNLKKYRNLIAFIEIYLHGSGGRVAYKSSSGKPVEGPARQFSALNDGRELQFRSGTPELLKLGSQIVSQILTEAVCPPEGVLIDLDAREYLGSAAALLVTSHDTRSLAEWQFWNNNIFNLKMSSPSARTSFSAFEGFKKWFCHGAPSSTPYAATRLEKPIGQIVLHLDFSTGTTTFLEDLRVSVVDFILASSHASAKRLGHDYLSLRIKTAELQHTIPLSRLRMNVLVFLAKLLDQHPNIKIAKSPEIFINGLGEVADFRFPGTSSLKNAYNIIGRPGRNYHNVVRYVLYLYDADYDTSPSQGSTECLFRYLSEVVQREDQSGADAAAQKYFGVKPEAMDIDVPAEGSAVEGDTIQI